MTSNTPNRLPGVFLLLSRILLVQVGLLMVIMPWTERYQGFDNFPNGPDLETNLLAFLALFALMLLVMQLCHKGLAARIAICCSVSRLKLGRRPDYASILGFHAFASHRTPLPGPPSFTFNLPLQI